MPGVTAGVAAPAYAGIPVTQRGLSAAVAFVTGHEDPAKPGTLIDWPALAAFPGTLVFYMGVRSLERIASQLVAGGRPGSEPVAVIQRGTFPDQRTVAGTLDDIAGLAAAGGVRAPAITVVGAVAGLRERAGLVSRRPAGRPQRRRDARPGAGQPARRPAAGARRPRRRGAGDPHRAAGRRAARPRRLRPALRHEPQRRAPAAGARPRRPCADRPRDRRDRAGDRRRAARGRDRGRHRAAAGGRGVARRDAGRPPGAPCAHRPRREGA